MNRFLHNKIFLFIATLMLLISSCKDSGLKTDMYLGSVPMGLSTRIETLLNFSAEGGSKSFYVESENVKWIISEYPDWITVSPDNGSSTTTVNVHVSKNESTTTGRTGIIKVSSLLEGFSKTINVSVSQDRILTQLKFDNSQITYDGCAGTYSVPFTANTTEFSVTKDADWLTVVSTADSKFSFSVTENTMNVSRKAQLSFVTSDNTTSLTIIQRVANISATSDRLDYNCYGGLYTLGVNSQATWTTSTSASWLNLEQDGSTLAITAMPNAQSSDREGYIYLFIGDNKRIEIPVYQSGVNITPMFNDTTKMTGITFFRGQTNQYNVISNVGWYIDSKLPDWIDISPKESTEGKNPITVVVKENSTTENDTCVVVFHAQNINYSKSIRFINQGKYFDSYSGTLEVESTPSSWYTQISGNDYWNAYTVPNAQWIEFEEASGWGARDEFTFYVADNPSINRRNTSIIIDCQYSGTPAEIKVIQSARYLKVDAANICFFAKGGNSEVITIGTDGRPAYKNDADWLTVTFDSTTMILHAKPNDTDNIRYDKVRVYLEDVTDGNIEQVINIVQSKSGSLFLKNGYGTDTDYNSGKQISDNLSIKSYTTDVDWDKCLGINNPVISLTRYTIDKDLNVDDNDTLQVAKNSYGVDKVYNVTDVDRLELSQTDLTISPEDSAKLYACGYINNQKISINPSWSSSNTSVATVSNSGLVKAIGLGTATISATANGSVASCTITVIENIKTITVNGVSLKMIKVDGGTFWMGAQSSSSGSCNYDSEAYVDESPVHQVTLSSYVIGQTEVTQALWKAVMGNNPSYSIGDNLPVEQVSWDDCQEFISKLNLLTGKNFRLPTEAEWEYAARGGSKSNGYKYSGSNTIENVAWFSDNGSSKTHPVGTRSANELGIYDMSGNVYEWCSDWYGNYSSSAQTDPTGPATGVDRALRGGSVLNDAINNRVTFRGSGYYPDYLGNYLGLRLALDLAHPGENDNPPPTL